MPDECQFSVFYWKSFRVYYINVFSLTLWNVLTKVYCWHFMNLCRLSHIKIRGTLNTLYAFLLRMWEILFNNLIFCFFFQTHISSVFFFFLQFYHFNPQTAFSQDREHFLQVTFWICSFWHLYVFMHFALPYLIFLKSKCNNFQLFVWHIFFLLLGSISLSSDFFANLLFLNSLFSLYFPSQYDPGANTKKNADDITSNDRGEDEGIFCFFKARPWCMVLYLSLYFFFLF